MWGEGGGLVCVGLEGGVDGLEEGCVGGWGAGGVGGGRAGWLAGGRAAGLAGGWEGWWVGGVAGGRAGCWLAGLAGCWLDAWKLETLFLDSHTLDALRGRRIMFSGGATCHAAQSLLPLDIA